MTEAFATQTDVMQSLALIMTAITQAAGDYKREGSLLCQEPKIGIINALGSELGGTIWMSRNKAKGQLLIPRPVLMFSMR